MIIPSESAAKQFVAELLKLPVVDLYATSGDALTNPALAFDGFYVYELKYYGMQCVVSRDGEFVIGLPDDSLADLIAELLKTDL